MSDDELNNDAEEELVEEEIDDEELGDEDLGDDLEIDLDDDLGDDEVVAGDLAVDAVEAVDPVDPAVEVVTAAPAKGDDEEEEDVLDLDEELHPDDVEAPLDALLKERTAAAKMEDDEEELEEEEVELDDRGAEGPTKIVPRRADEFLCTSCFLVLPRNQLADEARMLCRDCA